MLLANFWKKNQTFLSKSHHVSSHRSPFWSLFLGHEFEVEVDAKLQGLAAAPAEESRQNRGVKFYPQNGW